MYEQPNTDSPSIFQGAEKESWQELNDRQHAEMRELYIQFIRKHSPSELEQDYGSLSLERQKRWNDYCAGLSLKHLNEQSDFGK